MAPYIRCAVVVNPASVPFVRTIDLMPMVGSDTAFRHVADEEVFAVTLWMFGAEVLANPVRETGFLDWRVAGLRRRRSVLIGRRLGLHIQGVHHDRLSQKTESSTQEMGARSSCLAAILDYILDSFDRGFHVEQNGQSMACTIDPALDRADGAARDIGGFLIGQAGGADHDDSFAMFGRQGVQRGSERGELGGPFLAGLGGQSGGVAAFFVGDFPAPLGGARVPTVPQNGEKPCAQIAARLEPRPMRPALVKVSCTRSSASAAFLDKVKAKARREGRKPVTDARQSTGSTMPAGRWKA